MMLYFTISFSLMLFTALWMWALARKFQYRDAAGVETPFSILDLQFPSSEQELCNIIAGLSPAARKALRGHLWVDFLFMAGFYPSIAFLCIIVGDKTGAGQYFFWLMATLQLYAWMFDIQENGYCLRKLRKPVVSATKNAFQSYSFFVYAKFILCLTGVAVSVSALFYCWITGNFEMGSLWYVGVLLVELLIAWRIKAAL
ncbi:hypothetical protein GFS24_05565 [Chitinophaga sp. SYP-B3965]|uniref:hypothetical protein n=1 Tax=Chitinophaga sp. SYP-B3965 TaxID=2663120 RepID=UPI001299C1AF|nr:hypothetical protein [Chitinophaga sp. SYP-B3965]MRG44570.1 hypothetical protein [Chitinophaga sp. SYP-B3965]